MVDAMGIARLLDSQQPGNTHGIYHFGTIKTPATGRARAAETTRPSEPQER